MTYRINKTLLTAFAALISGAALAGPFTPGSLVVTQFGTDGGGSALTSAATATYLKEFTIAGSPLQTIAIDNTSANKLTNSATSTSEGGLQMGGGYLWFSGYNATVGSTGGTAVGGSGTGTGIGNSSGAFFPRAIARVDMNGNVDLSTQLTDCYTAGTVRSACSSDGNAIWVAGTGSPAASGGIRYATLGATTSTQITTTPTNTRVANIFGGQLYGSSSSGTFLGVYSIGTGLPTTADTCTLLLGFPDLTGTGNSSTYDFEFVGANTLYACDDRSVASGGALVKWVFSGGSWSIAYKLTSGLGTVGTRSICRLADVGGSPQFAVVTGEGAGATSRVMTIIDNGLGLDSFNLVTTSGTNTSFRGVEYIPAAAGRTITGNVHLQDFGGAVAGRQAMIELWIGAVPVDAQLVTLDGSGNYSLTTLAVAGTYDVYAKGSHWLRRLNAGVVVGAGGASGVNFSLLNADINDDNAIDIGDYSLLSLAYGSFNGDPNYTDASDLNGDDEVNIGDYSILSQNYGLFGD